MLRLLTLALTLFGLIWPSSGFPSSVAVSSVSIRWLGHACFVIEAAIDPALLDGAYQIAIDPYSAGVGYPVTPLEANVVFISHEHFDHNNTAMFPLARVIRGLKNDGKAWAQIDEKLADGISVRTVGAYHDPMKGKERGLNSVAIFNVGGLHIVHLGDLGHLLTADEIKSIGPVDVLMIPVGGFFTIDGKQAQQVVRQLKPKIVIPMHYKTSYTSPKLPIVSVDSFLTGAPWPIKRLSTSVLSISFDRLPKITTVFVLEPLGAGPPYRL